MVTVTGTLSLPDGTPDTGSVRFALAAPAVLRDATPELVTAAHVIAHLDEDGQISAELIPSDDPAWATEDPVPYQVQIRTAGLRADYAALITTDCHIADLVALDGPIQVVAVPGPPGPPATWA